MQKENTSFGILYQIIKNNPRYAYATVMDIISAGVDTVSNFFWQNGNTLCKKKNYFRLRNQ